MANETARSPGSDSSVCRPRSTFHVQPPCGTSAFRIPRSAFHTSAGFTLIEAVLAVAIMSICAFALMAAASKCLALAGISRNLHTVSTVIDQGELEYPLQPTNEISDNVVAPVSYANGFTFERTVEPLGKEEDIFVVKTKVSWSAKGKHASESVETLLYSTNHP